MSLSTGERCYSCLSRHWTLGEEGCRPWMLRYRPELVQTRDNSGKVGMAMRDELRLSLLDIDSRMVVQVVSQIRSQRVTR